MSWHFSQALEAEYSAQNSSDGEPFAPWKSTPFAPDDSCSAKMRATFHRSPFGTTYVPSTDTLGEAVLTWFREGFHARTLALLEKGVELEESEVGYGTKWQELSVRFDPDSHSWKTHLCLWEEDLPLSSVILPRWGIMRDGVCLELLTSERPISESASGLWPTPDTCAGGIGSGKIRPSQIQRNQPRLQDAVMWATPNARDWKEARLSPALAKQAEENPFQNITRQLSKADPSLHGGLLNPTWVEWLMGWSLGWTDLQPLETDKFRQWFDSHGEFWARAPMTDFPLTLAREMVTRSVPQAPT